MTHLFRIKSLSAFPFFLILLSSLFIDCQTFNLNNDLSFLEVHGTSSLHDWHVDAQKQSGTLSIGNIETLGIKELSFSVMAESLKSGKKGMDKNTYKALNTGKFKTIDFTLSSVNTSQKISDSEYELTVSGHLKISGKTNEILLDLKFTVNENKVLIEGEKNILMTDYGVKPPKALLGTIKTGDEIKIIFKALYEN